MFKWLCGSPPEPSCIGRIEVAALGPNDVLVFSTEDRLSLSRADLIRENFKRGGITNRVLVIEGGAKLSVLTPAEIETKSSPVQNVIRFMGKELSELTQEERDQARRYAQQMLEADCLMPFTFSPEQSQEARKGARRLLDALKALA